MFGVKFSGRGIELHNYALATGAKNYIYEYQNDKIEFIDYSIFNSDYYWFVFHETSVTGFSYILKMSKTRRYVYLSNAKTTFSSLVFPDKNPLFVGFTDLNEPFLVQLNNSNFNNLWSRQISNVKSNMMTMKNRFANDITCIWALSDIVDRTIHIALVNANSSTIQWTKTYDQKLTNPNIAWAPVFAEYMLVGKDTDKSRHCFMRFTISGGEITYLFCTADGSISNYNLFTTSFHLDSKTSLYIGGQLNSENFFYYRTGAEIGDRSCLFIGSTLYNSSYYNSNQSDWVQVNHSLTWATYLDGRWINRTDREVKLDKNLKSTHHCLPLFNLPLLRNRHYTQRYMETLPKICPGFKQSEVLNTSIFTFQSLSGVKNNTSVVFSSKSYASHQVSSFWMDQGIYDNQLTMYNASNPNTTMTIAFKSRIELTWFMLLNMIIVYIVYIVIGVQAVISKDYYCFKNLIYTGQFIHIISLLAIDLPPPFVYFVQRMSIFGMIEGIFSKIFILDSFNFMQEDRFYRANYETTSFISNQALSVIITL